jgi:hypothetical protein
MEIQNGAVAKAYILLTASSYMGKYLCISSYIRKPFLINDFATAPLRISLYMGKFDFLFCQCALWFYFLSVRSFTYHVRHYWILNIPLRLIHTIMDHVWCREKKFAPVPFLTYAYPAYPPCALSVHCPCAVSALSVRCQCTVHALSKHCLCTVRVLSVHSPSTFQALSVHCPCPVRALSVRCPCAVRTLSVRCPCAVRALSVHYPCAILSLPSHCMPTEFIQFNNGSTGQQNSTKNKRVTLVSTTRCFIVDNKNTFIFVFVIYFMISFLESVTFWLNGLNFSSLI